MRRKLDNRGYTMIIVIIVIAFVSLLAATILTVSTVNIQMKGVDRKSKETFYSAEEALDQINLGLQKEISQAVETAYAQVMMQYTQYQLEVERQTIFNDKYFDVLRKAVAVSETDTTKYSLDTLDGYLSDELKALTEITSSSASSMTFADGKLILHGVIVTYTDAEAYQSVIETDICLSAPDLNLIQPGDLSDVFEYCIIANEKLEAKNAGTVTIEANVYAGESEAAYAAELQAIANGTSTGADLKDMKVGLSLQDVGSVFNFSQVKTAIVSGDVVVGDTSALNVTTNMDFWAENIKVNGGTLSTMGKTFVAGDIIMSDEASEVTLSGEYYGYGNGDGLTLDGIEIAKEGDGSAILINGTDTLLDMRELDRLMVSGSAQISTGSVQELEGQPDNKDIGLGESIEVKSNQIAYLVPPECIGVNNGETIVGKNPMSYSEYQQLMDYSESDAYPNFEIVSFTKVIEGLNKNLREYFTPTATDNGYQTIFVPLASGQSMVYFYVDFDSESASEFFREYYAENKGRMDGYMDSYVNKILWNNSLENIYADGNMLHSANTGMNLKSNENFGANYNATQDFEQAENELTLQKRFEALTTRLTTDYDGLEAAERGKSVFTNFIRDDAFAGISANGNTYTTPGSITGREVKAVVVANAGGTAYRYKDDVNKEICLILASGDVILEQDFEGIVIAKGTVTVLNNSVYSIRNNVNDVHRILRAHIDSTDITSDTVLERFFKDTAGASVETGTGTTGTDDDYIIFSDYIIYDGWTKR